MEEFAYKIKNKLSDGSIDSEHYIALFYCLIMVLPMIGIYVEFLILKQTSIVFFKMLEFFCFAIVSGLFFKYYAKKMLSYFKKKRFMLGLLSLSIVTAFFLFMLVWLSVFFGNLSNLINVYLLSESQPLLQGFKKNIINSIDSVSILSQNMIIFSQIIGISLLSNMMVPKSLQKVDVPLIKKFLRLSLKMAFLFILSLIIFIFLNTNKDNFSVVSIVYAGVIWVADPKNFIAIFSNVKIVENKIISDEATRLYKIFRYFLIGIYAIWAATVYIFPANKVAAFFIMSFIFIFVSIIAQLALQSKEEDVFSKLLKDKESEAKVEEDSE